MALPAPLLPGRPPSVHAHKIPPFSSLPPGFNYWWPADEDHGIGNLTEQVPPDDTEYLSDAFERYLVSRDGKPFMAQISFHNCGLLWDAAVGRDAIAKTSAPGRASICSGSTFLVSFAVAHASSLLSATPSAQATSPTLARRTGAKSAPRAAPASRATTLMRSWTFTPA